MAKDPLKDKAYLRLLEPWKGGHTPFDTGLGNRLLHWDVAYRINEANGFDHFIELEYKYWRELRFIQMPGIWPFRIESAYYNNTFFKLYGDDGEMQRFISKHHFDREAGEITKLPLLGNKEVQEVLTNQKINLTEKRYYVDFDWDYVGEFRVKYKTHTPSGLSRVRIIQKSIADATKSTGAYAVGIHLRRGAGVFKSINDLKELPDSVSKNPETQAIHEHTIYKYYKNSMYIRLIEEILQINPNQKFYISSDLKSNEYTFIKDRFGDRIKTREDIIKNLPTGDVQGINFNNPADPDKVALESVVDMFTLANCQFILGAPHSTWLDAITKIRPVRYMSIKNPRDTILKEYKRAIKHVSSML
jgi:hypothetical protein